MSLFFCKHRISCLSTVYSACSSVERLSTTIRFFTVAVSQMRCERTSGTLYQFSSGFVRYLGQQILDIIINDRREVEAGGLLCTLDLTKSGDGLGVFARCPHSS